MSRDDHLRHALAALRAAVDHVEAACVEPAPRDDAPWPERVWTVPPETRLSTREAAAALGCSTSALYHDAIGPRARRAGRRRFYVADDLRAYLRRSGGGER